MRCRIAMYLRLSKEDLGQEESGSIQNQRRLLRGYAKEHFPGCPVEEFSDDGFTGTNMQRPQVTQMLKAAWEGRVDCILVKDFSRFSRDYLALGDYLEHIFPMLGVRFISVNDGYDSITHPGSVPELETAFLGLLYDLYSRDLSMKVKAALEIRKAQGIYSMANTPFGYGKDQKTGRLIPEEEEAQIVRRIFHLAEKGMGPTEIAGILNQEGISPPGWRRGRAQGKSGKWGKGTVSAILKNQVYTGDFVYGKYKRTGPGGKNVKTPKEEWRILANHHPPLVEREVFQAVQKKGGRSCAFPYQERG